MQTDMNTLDRLGSALAIHFSEAEAVNMAILINAALASENVYTEQIPLAEQDKHDLLLMAYEERILLPVRSRRTSAWEDRTLRIVPEEMFFMPHVVRILFNDAAKTGVMDVEEAVRKVLSHHPAEHVDEAVHFLKQMKPHTDARMAEGGLMVVVAKKAGIALDVHEIVDACVVGGIMSPCTRGFSTQGLAWYEFHPCLFWHPDFH